MLQDEGEADTLLDDKQQHSQSSQLWGPLYYILKSILLTQWLDRDFLADNYSHRLLPQMFKIGYSKCIIPENVEYHKTYEFHENVDYH